jgi:3-methyl-2-oxobutanoate hydroxymethyltransferase
VDLILVGDSLGNVVQGLDSTLPVTLEEVIYHARSVRRAIQRAHLVADMPFMTYQVTPEMALVNAGRLMKEAQVQSVKLEGGAIYADTVKRITQAGIPVMGHLGLTPQSVHQLGGYRVQGRDEPSARLIIEDALALEEAGAYSLVLECVPERLAKEITSVLSIPTIGIGAGVYCDGQILVFQDAMGMNRSFSPRFVRRYAELGDLVKAGLENYVEEVQKGAFPGPEETFDPQPQLAVAH